MFHALFILLLNFCWFYWKFSLFFFHFINNNSEGNKTINGDDDTDNGNDDDNVIDYFYDRDAIEDDVDIVLTTAVMLLIKLVYDIDDCNYGDFIHDVDDLIENCDDGDNIDVVMVLLIVT